MKTPHVTNLSKEKDTGETNDGDCIKETEMGREKKVGFQTNVLVFYNLGFDFIQLKFSLWCCDCCQWKGRQGRQLHKETSVRGSSVSGFP